MSLDDVKQAKTEEIYIAFYSALTVACDGQGLNVGCDRKHVVDLLMASKALDLGITPWNVEGNDMIMRPATSDSARNALTAMLTQWHTLCSHRCDLLAAVNAAQDESTVNAISW